MSIQEAIEHGKDQLDIFGGEHREFIEMAIKALEQQPCEDCISRQEAINCVTSNEFRYKIVEDIKTLPSVTPKEKTGKWIKTQSGDDMFPEIIVCSKCNNENSHLDFNEHAEPIGKVFIKSKFCPNCGAKMVEPQESEVSE